MLLPAFSLLREEEKQLSLFARMFMLHYDQIQVTNCLEFLRMSQSLRTFLKSLHIFTILQVISHQEYCACYRYRNDAEHVVWGQNAYAGSIFLPMELMTVKTVMEIPLQYPEVLKIVHVFQR